MQSFDDIVRRVDELISETRAEGFSAAADYLVTVRADLLLHRRHFERPDQQRVSSSPPALPAEVTR